MPRTPQDVTDAELAVLQVLWEHGPAQRRQLTDILYPGTGLAHYTTVQKLLERLEAKGHVVQQPGEGPRTYVAAVSREELIGRRLRAVADKLCEGSLTPLLTNLIRAEELTPQELQELRDLIDNLKKTNRPQGKRR
ncbi:MAG TPA: BlaI/MecI/CopY family transcriptional regulator [Gemmataceae bacterium]|nr:BlaI/MecI/CopY family transcriptional regulator [Gemmataceae bacterium]